MKKYILPICACMLLLTAACKPTEKNYRAAYERAQEKRHEGLTDEEFKLIAEESLPRFVHTPTDSIRTLSVGLICQYIPQGCDTINRLKGSLAVGKYTQLTNARAHADQLWGKGIQARVLRTGKPEYYVVTTCGVSLDSVISASKQIKASGLATPGLPEPIAVMAR